MYKKNNSVWEATLHIANAQNGEKILYDIDPIKIVDGTASPSKKLGTSPTTSTTDSIRQGGENVNTQFSMRSSSGAVTLNVENSTEEDGYTYDNIAIMLDGKEVGTIGMVADENEPYLERIDIDEEYRNKGIGTDALRLIAEKYGEFLIAPDNEDAKRLYERYGDESTSDNAAYIDQGYGVYSISSVPESKGYTARQANVKYSMRVDSDGRELSEAQQEFFKDSKVRDEEGRLLTLYHGTKSDFNTFEYGHTNSWNMLGDGFYFTPDRRRAGTYAWGGRVLDVYLNLVNPFVSNNASHIELLCNSLGKSMNYINKWADRKGYGSGDFFRIANYADDKKINLKENLQNLGFDGIMYYSYGEFAEAVAYSSNQIKSVTNQTPTENPDIRYSMRGENWKPTLDKAEWEIVNYAIENKTGKELTETTGYFFRKEKGKTVFGIYSADDSTLLYAVHGKRAYKEYNLVKAFKEEFKNAAYSGTKGFSTWDETARMQYRASTANRSSTLAPGRYSGNDTLYGRQYGSNTDAALRNVLKNIFSERQTDGSRGSGEPGGDRGRGGNGGLTVSDLDKSQYQLRREDINRLNILEGLKPMRKSTGFFCCLKFRGIIIS